LYKKTLGILVLLLATSSYSATLTLTTKYGKTGGLAGNLNQVNDTVNGRNICPAVNTNANAIAGCDMSDDPGLNDNGTPNDPSDDAGGNEEQVTITGTLPAGTGFIWDGIPGSCDQTASSLSVDKKSITCIRKDFDRVSLPMRLWRHGHPEVPVI